MLSDDRRSYFQDRIGLSRENLKRYILAMSQRVRVLKPTPQHYPPIPHPQMNRISRYLPVGRGEATSMQLRPKLRDHLRIDFSLDKRSWAYYELV